MKSLIIAAVMILAVTVEAGAQTSSKVGEIEVFGAWARASAGRAGAGAAYFEIRNRGDEADRLVSARTEVAREAELHAHLMTDSVMRMERIDGLDLPPRGHAVLRPGGHHLMLMGLAKPLVKGRSFPLSLTFEKAGMVTVEVPILGIGARGPRRSEDGHSQGRHKN